MITTGTDPTLRTPPPPRRAGLGIPVLLSVFAALSAVLVLADVRSPIRAAVVGLFVLIGPGWAVLDRWDLARSWLGAALVVAISTSLTTCLLLVQLYTLNWSPQRALGLLMLVVLVVELVELARRLRSARASAR